MAAMSNIFPHRLNSCRIAGNFTLSMNNQNSNTQNTVLINRNHCRTASSRGGSAVQLPQDQTKREKLGGILSLSDQETNHARDKKKRSKQNLTRDQERRIVQRPASSRKKRKEIAVRTSLSSSGSAGQGRVMARRRRRLFPPLLSLAISGKLCGTTSTPPEALLCHRRREPWLLTSQCDVDHFFSFPFALFSPSSVSWSPCSLAASLQQLHFSFHFR